MTRTIASLLLATLLAFAAGTVQAQTPSERIVRVQKVGQYNEIEVVSSKAFPVGAQPLVLTIGTRSFTRYMHAKNGDMKIAVFYLTDTEFAPLKTGEAARVSYGSEGALTWSLGTFNRNLGVVQ